MYHIDGFDEMILASFRDIINSANMKFVDKSMNEFDVYLLINDYCTLRFTFDRGELACTIINPKTGTRKDATMVYKKLYPTENQFPFLMDVPYKDQIELYARMISQKLMNVLQGDFSWESQS
jgi:hypothetical protein